MSTNGKKIQCKICASGVSIETRTWISVNSVDAHIKGGPHLKAVGLLEDAHTQADVIERNKEADATIAREAELRLINCQNPTRGGDGKRRNPMSIAEQTMWDEYAVNGADFDAGVDEVDLGLERQRLEREVQEFGIWNAERTAGELGFSVGGEDEGPLLVEDEEDDVLAEIMRHAG